VDKEAAQGVNIFEYDDYRRYLNDKYEELKNTTKGFSYRAFAKKAGLSSWNYFLLVKKGQRNLSLKTIKKFAEALDLPEREAEYFESLVMMNQAQNFTQRDYYYKELLKIATRRGFQQLEAAQYAYYSHWYIPVIREMAELKDFRADPDWIARHVSPAITKREASEALETLKMLGMLTAEGGTLAKTEKSLSTGHEIRNLLVKNFHFKMIELGYEAIERYASDQREIGSLTLSLTSDQVAELKQRIFRFRQELLETFTTDLATDDIFQFNMQLFPVTRLDRRKKTEEPQ